MVKNIIISVPTHTGYIWSQCVTSLISNINILTRMGINVTYQPILKEAYPARVKNRAIKYMLDDPKCEAVVIVDYDLGFDPYAIAKLVNADVDFVGGSYPFKSGEGFPAVPYKNKEGKVFVNEKGLVAASFVPGGFIMIKRAVIDALDRTGNIRESEGMKFYFDEGFHFQSDPRWYGEDKVLCRRLIEAGIKIWIVPGIDFYHINIGGNDGNFAEYINEQWNKKCVDQEVKRIASSVSQSQ